jgi:hypothetical protein
LAATWSPSSPFLTADIIATYYAWTGRIEEALQWVERGLDVSPILLSSWMLPPGVWDRALDLDEQRVVSFIEQASSEAWQRVLDEKERVTLP